jgi:hypothetical protein
MICVSHPCALIDLARLCGAVTPLQWSAARFMWETGKSWSIHAGDDLLVIAGVTPIGVTGDFEAWFAAGPQAGKHLGPVVRAMRLTLSELPQSDILTFVLTANGRRLARLLGFEAAADTEIGEIWRYGIYGRRGSAKAHEGTTATVAG